MKKISSKWEMKLSHQIKTKQIPHPTPPKRANARKWEISFQIFH